VQRDGEPKRFVEATDRTALGAHVGHSSDLGTRSHELQRLPLQVNANKV
jgi:hypothetical protein